MIILGIETSCDETAAAVVEIKGGLKNRRFSLLSNVISSQIKLHQKYGGVVPELAARKHTENIIHVIDEALTQAKDKLKKKNKKIIDAIAVTAGPGLITSLMVGVETAKTLAWSWQIPLIPINHLEAHLYANWYAFNSAEIKKVKKIEFPILCLLVSGGHSELILMKDYGKYKIVGETLDDAAGEAFDKVAKILNLPYPGGPTISRLAEKGDATKIKFPRPLFNSKDFNFSFSGLKTAVLNEMKKPEAKNYKTEDVCASFQQAVIDSLLNKTIKAAQKYKIKDVLLAGGVSANLQLRKQAGERIKQELPDVNFYFPALEHCTDNAAMIALSGFFKYDKTMKPYNLEKININPNLTLGSR